MRKVIEPMRGSRADGEMWCELGRSLSNKLDLGVADEFSYSHSSEIWEEMAGLTPSIAGISYERLENEGGIQWPCPTPDHPGTRFLYEHDFPRGPRAKFVGFEQGPQAEELPTKRFPLILNTGRILYHWHGGTMTRRSSNLLAHAPEIEISMSADDGKRYDVADGQWIRLRSRRGDLEGRVSYSEKMRAGEIFVPFVKLGDHAANFLTNAVYDQVSRIPEYKVCAVRIEAIEDADGSSSDRVIEAKSAI